MGAGEAGGGHMQRGQAERGVSLPSSFPDQKPLVG